MNNWRNKALPSLTLVLASIVLSMLAVIVAAVPLRALRVLSGKKAYWILSFLTVVLFLAVKAYSTALILGSLVVLIGSFTEFEKSGDSIYKAGACSILLTVGYWATNFMVLFFIKGNQAWLYVQAKINSIIESISKLYAQYNGAEVSVTEIQSAVFTQAPSILLMALMLSIFLAILLEKKVMGWVAQKATCSAYNLIYFRVHDIVIWSFILSLLGSFSTYENEVLKVVSINVLYVSMTLLFFQGLAVMAHFFKAFNVGTLWQIFWFYICIVHVTLFVSLIGLMDYWLNFRRRFTRYVAQVRKSQ